MVGWQAVSSIWEVSQSISRSIRNIVFLSSVHIERGRFFMLELGTIDSDKRIAGVV